MPRSTTSTPEPIINPPNRFNPTLLAFKPRQVLLANPHTKQTKPNGSNDGMATTLSPGQKGPLLRAVARFLETNGFSKTLKKFRSEAEIEKSGLKDSLLDLEEMYCKYTEMCKNGGTTVKSQTDKEKSKEPEHLLEEADKNCKAKKKKKSKTSDSLPHETEENVEDDIHLKEKSVSNPETEKKSKDKKKNKSKSDSVIDAAGQNGLEAKQDANGIGGSIADENPSEDKSVKAKSKKKKKDGLVPESLGGEDMKVAHKADTNGITSIKDDPKKYDVDVTEKENKGSKKRKRLASEGSVSQPTENREDEESKRRKVEGLKASKGSEQLANSDVSLGRAETADKDSKVENGQIGMEVLDGQIHGNLDKSAEKSSTKKSMKKQRNGSAEPKTAFQRVKIEEVEFVDEKLKDNSYWAKDGAEIGYGAKAQEILGQVRGRDFRHEKTKKKRGTYRGGVIDQDSHSVKFNYSDED